MGNYGKSPAPQSKVRRDDASPKDAEEDEGLFGWLLSWAAACGGIDPLALGHRQLCPNNLYNYKRQQQQQQHRDKEEEGGLHRRYNRDQYTYSGVGEGYPCPAAPELTARGEEERQDTSRQHQSEDNTRQGPPPPRSTALRFTSVEAINASQTVNPSDINRNNGSRPIIPHHHRLDRVMRFEDEEGVDENDESGDDHEDNENESVRLRANNAGVGGENGLLLLERSVPHHITSALSTPHRSPIRLTEGENNDQQDGEHAAGVEDNALTPTLPYQQQQHDDAPRRLNNDENPHVTNSEPERQHTARGLATPQTTETRTQSESMPQMSSPPRRGGGYLESLFRQLETTGSVRRVRGGNDGNAVISIVQNTPERAPPRMVNGIPMSIRKTCGGGGDTDGGSETSSLSQNGTPPHLRDEKGNTVTHEYF